MNNVFGKLVMMALAGLLAGSAMGADRFGDNGDGTITDTRSGLIWMKNANCWGQLAWADGMERIADLNRGSATCPGYTGTEREWRLPTRDELVTLLITASGHDLAISADHPFVNAQGAHYWSSTTGPRGETSAWYINLHNGHIDSFGKQEPYFIWPVRGKLAVK